MSLSRLIQELRQKGIHLKGEGGNLVVEGPVHLLSDDIWNTLKREKTQLLPLVTPLWSQRASTLLSHIPSPAFRSDLRFAFEERAGIHEYEGGLPRDEAERLAYEYLRGLIQGELK